VEGTWNGDPDGDSVALDLVDHQMEGTEDNEALNGEQLQHRKDPMVEGIESAVHWDHTAEGTEGAFGGEVVVDDEAQSEWVDGDERILDALESMMAEEMNMDSIPMMMQRKRPSVERLMALKSIYKFSAKYPSGRYFEISRY